jgi:hypothetical protein
MSDTHNTINWQEPIEAVHEDGRVVPAKVVSIATNNNQVDIEGDGLWWVYDSGEVPVTSWTIRNTKPEQATEWGPEIKVEGKRPEWLGDWHKFQWRLNV